MLGVVLLTIAAVLHGYWAIANNPKGITLAVPQKNGAPAFVPTRVATFLVAICLAAMAGLLASSIGWLPKASTAFWPKIALWLCAVIFALRAIGERHYVGMLKTVRNSRFAQLDDLLFTPACLLLSTIFIVTAMMIA